MLKFRSRPIAEHDEVPLADDGAFEDIIDRFDAITPGRDPARRASYVVSVGP